MEVTVMPAAAPVQKQQGLNQIVINKVQKMIEGKQQGVMATITRLLGGCVKSKNQVFFDILYKKDFISLLC